MAHVWRGGQGLRLRGGTGCRLMGCGSAGSDSLQTAKSPVAGFRHRWRVFVPCQHLGALVARCKASASTMQAYCIVLGWPSVGAPRWYRMQAHNMVL